MTLFVVGLNHLSAPVETREQLAYAEQDLPQTLNELKAVCHVESLVLVSTCNRTEFYFTAIDSQPIINWIQQQTEENISSDHIYILEQEKAVNHLFKVACGLDSMVIGEPQITGQLKTAHQIAHAHNHLNTALNKLFECAFSASKKVRTETNIGSQPVSVAYASVKLARRIFSHLSETNVLLIGAGDTINLVAQHLRSAKVKNITIANRSKERAHSIALDNEKIISIGDIPGALESADIVISSTASTLPILGKGMLETALKSRKHQPYFMIDLAVPRDIEPEAGELDDVYLYTVDDLRHVIEDNKRMRQDAAKVASSIIEHCVYDYMDWLNSLQATSTITALREHIELICTDHIEKSIKAINKGDSTEQALTQLKHSLTNKLLHFPSTSLRKAAEKDDIQLINAARKLFNLEP